jgi:hypothetical protein
VLSRSASAEGTIILQGFNLTKITSGIKGGALRQEYRELEILDDITTLNYNSKLPPHVYGEDRILLMYSYMKYKGLNYVPPFVHSAIRWNKSDPIYSLPKWKIVDLKPSKILDTEHMQSSSILPAKCSTTCQTSLKRKQLYSEDQRLPSSKSRRMSGALAANLTLANGPTWHRNSCAYNSILAIIMTVISGMRILGTLGMKLLLVWVRT